MNSTISKDITKNLIYTLGDLTDNNRLRWKTIPEYMYDVYKSTDIEVSSEFYDIILPFAKTGMLHEHHSYCAQYKAGLIIILYITSAPDHEIEYNGENYKIYVQATNSSPGDQLFSDTEISKLLYKLLEKIKGIHNKLIHKPTTEEFINDILHQ